MSMDEAIFREKLEKLNTSQQSIESLSGWCQFHRGDARRVAEVRPCLLPSGKGPRHTRSLGEARPSRCSPTPSHRPTNSKQPTNQPKQPNTRLQVWEDYFSKAAQPQRLAMVYLANDILQNRCA